MPRKPIEPEDVFLKRIKSLVKNLFVENKNFSNGHYDGRASHDIIRMVQDNGRYILEEIELMEHLVKQPTEDQT